MASSSGISGIRRTCIFWARETCTLWQRTSVVKEQSYRLTRNVDPLQNTFWKLIVVVEAYIMRVSTGIPVLGAPRGVRKKVLLFILGCDCYLLWYNQVQLYTQSCVTTVLPGLKYCVTWGLFQNGRYRRRQIANISGYCTSPLVNSTFSFLDFRSRWCTVKEQLLYAWSAVLRSLLLHSSQRASEHRKRWRFLLEDAYMRIYVYRKGRHFVCVCCQKGQHAFLSCTN